MAWTTAEVRQPFEADEGVPTPGAAAAFDAWLAAHEAEVAAKALEDVADNAEDALSESSHQQWDHDWIIYLREVAYQLRSADHA